MTIWKFPFEITGLVNITMPEGATVLHVECENRQPCMWAMVDPQAPKALRQFYTIGTGHPFPDRVGAHIGTFQMHGGSFIWHIFERAAS